MTSAEVTGFPSLLHSEDEQELRASVRRLLSDRADWPIVLKRTEDEQPYDADTWRRLAAETGVASLPVPEDAGGAGASWRESAVVAEELGRSVAIVPFLGSAVLSTAALLAAGDTVLLPELAAGERTAALAVPLSTWPGSAFPTTVSVDGDTLTGTVSSIADARAADLVLVPASASDGPSLWAVETFTASPRTSLDMTGPLADLTLSGASGRLIAQGPAAQHALQHALTVGAGILASEQLGLAEQCLDTTVAHLKTRYQFGRPLGSFQGLKHRVASLWVEVTRARAVARYAAGCLATEDPDTGVAVAVAASLCSDVAVLAAEECVQLHGGLGFTWEHPAHLWLKRAKADQIALGTPDRHRAALAALVDLPLNGSAPLGPRVGNP
jgi:alkylation response protein AidB-like acyl-CoA dehydrogenase